MKHQAIYQVKEIVADDSNYGLLVDFSVDDILEKYPFLKQFENEMRHEMFSLRLAVDLWELSITYVYTLVQIGQSEEKVLA